MHKIQVQYKAIIALFITMLLHNRLANYSSFNHPSFSFSICILAQYSNKLPSKQRLIASLERKPSWSLARTYRTPHSILLATLKKAKSLERHYFGDIRVWIERKLNYQPNKSNASLLPSVISQSSPRVSLSGRVRAYLLKAFSKCTGMNLKEMSSIWLDEDGQE